MVTASAAIFPNFLGIGVPKAGTTWLYELLQSHPDVWLPERKEVHFFDRNYDRGLDWYSAYFAPSAGSDCKRRGEITPHYIYEPAAAERIASLGTVDKFVVLFRDPVERAHSHYWFRVRVDGYRGSFEEFLRERPESVEWGFYARHLRPYLERFGRDSILALQYETAVADKAATSRTLASFLGLDPASFVVSSAEPVNERFVPQWPRLYATGAWLGRALRDSKAEWLVAQAKRMGAVRLLTGRKRNLQRQGIAPEVRRRLADTYSSDTEDLERLLGMDFHAWRTSWAR